MDAGATKFCSNCRREIGAANFTMHELHCQRNIVLCDKCQEPVPRSQLSEHESSVHALVACPLCGEEVETSRLSAHENECPRRPVKCPVCEMEVGFDLFVDHVNYCESRTQQCPLCHRYVMMKDLDRHETSNCEYPERPPAETNADISEDADAPPAYFRESSFAAKELHRMLNFPFAGEMPMGGYGIGSSTLSDVDFSPLAAERTMLPCEFCNTLFSSDMILAHQSSCPRDPAADGDHLASLMTGMRMPPPPPPPPHLTAPYIASDSDDDVVDAEETPLPCEFCDELFPASALPQHQGVCPRDALRSARGERTPPVTVEDMLRPVAVRRRDEMDSAGRGGAATPPMRFGVGMWSSEAARGEERGGEERRETRGRGRGRGHGRGHGHGGVRNAGNRHPRKD